MNQHRTASLVGTGLLAVLLIAGGSGEAAQPEPSADSQRANAGMSAIQDRAAASPAEALYVEKCAMCHRQFGMGTTLLARRLAPDQAQLEDRSVLPAAFIVAAARQGIGNMPPISRGEVSDTQLAEIAAYLAGEQP